MTRPVVVDPTRLLPVRPLADHAIRVVQPSEVQRRLQQMRAVLEAFGVPGLEGLGTLEVSGQVVSSPGLTRPSTPQLGRRVPVSGFLRGVTPGLVAFGGEAVVLDAESLTAALPGGIRSRPRTAAPAAGFPLDTPYWAGTTIRIADGTTVVLQHPHSALVIIADSIVVGDGVTFTWQVPAPAVAQRPARPSTPGRQPTATTVGRPPRATPGRPGLPGGPGASGLNGPAVEFWTLSLTGRPVFDLHGQAGGPGGPGGHGGHGAPGTVGSPDRKIFVVVCTDGPGNGGHGGHGGSGGDGGPGGTGGAGGSLAMFAPSDQLARYQAEFTLSVEGGGGGDGGQPGVGGDGGEGGERGDNSHGCDAPEPRTSGSSGATGRQGSAGAKGTAGPRGTVSMRAITHDEFRQALTRPAISTLSTGVAAEGETVTAAGLRFTATDVVLLDGVAASTTVVGDTQLAFVVPAVAGGIRTVLVQQSDGTRSNQATLYVRPTLTRLSASRVRAGDLVVVTGTGFAPGSRVVLDGEDMAEVSVSTVHELEFRVRRSDALPLAPDGTTVDVAVVLPDRGPNSSSDPLPLVLRPFHMLVIGDSVAWGQGLVEEDKFHSRVAAAIGERLGSGAVHVTLRAHSGAVIGADRTDVAPPVDGEVPTELPTLFQQLRVVAAERTPEELDDVGLVLLSGGINDVDVLEALLAVDPPTVIDPRADRFCRVDMVVLLREVRATAPQAKIVVVGYFPILSPDSDPTLIEMFLVALGARVGGLLGAALTITARHHIVQNAGLLHARTQAALAAAVAEVEASDPGTVVFADPGFGERNAALASEPLLFGVNPDLTTQDPDVVGARTLSCFDVGLPRTNPPVCVMASVGHPNREGASQIADAIVALLP